MKLPDSDAIENEEVCLPKWVTFPVGIILGLFTLLCLTGSITLVISPNERAPLLAPVIGIVMVLGCLWSLEKCVRLVTGRKRKGGLMTPRALRVIGWVFLLLPIGGLFSGYFVTHTLLASLQTAAYVSVFFGLRRLAAYRESNV